MEKLFIPALAFLFVQCQSPKPETQTQAAFSKKDSVVMKGNSVFTNDCKNLYDEARKMDSVILKSTQVDAKVGNKAVKAFSDFSFYCKQDSLAPVFLIKASQIATTINNLPQAQLCLERCINDFPDFKNRGAAMFLLAQLYDEPQYLNNEDKARDIYSSIISLYPRSEWARQASAARSLIGKTDEEIIKEFNKKNKK